MDVDSIFRRKTKQIQVGSVKIGGDAPIVVQSMTNTDTRDVGRTVAQILALQEAGCEIVRVAVLDEEALDALPYIKKQIQIPMIADIHFHHRLAIGAIKNGADGIRINPGNIARDKIAEIIEVAKKSRTVIRIGINSGSLEKDLIVEYGGSTAEALCASAMRNIAMFEKMDFDLIKLSLKSSNVPTMIKAYRMISEKTDYPLHLGVTEAGMPADAAVKSALGIGMLLHDGIGDTIRVSVTGSPVQEMPIAYGILRALGIRKTGAEIISCPTCGRCQIDVVGLAEKVAHALAGRKKYIKVALMGCVVNGPGEAAEADIGIAGGRAFGMLFKKGAAYKNVEEKDFVSVLLSEIDAMDEQK
ncbi:MAG: flavodoxin-dependent (E)-4-hydroxy-3-methylbut-2-enyl-diphosphate synthase [Smithellaceae bacterium]